MALKLIVAPTPIVTFAEADQQLRLDGDATQQALIESYIAAATQHLDGWAGIVGRALGSQTWELVLDSFPCGSIKIPLGPLASVASVKHLDTDGVEQTIDPANYYVDAVSPDGWVVPVSSYSWPSTLDAVNTVTVRFVSGGAAWPGGAVPAPLKTAILLMVAHLNENREAVGSDSLAVLPLGVDRLIAPYRRVGF